MDERKLKFINLWNGGRGIKYENSHFIIFIIVSDASVKTRYDIFFITFEMTEM